MITMITKARLVVVAVVLGSVAVFTAAIVSGQVLGCAAAGKGDEPLSDDLHHLHPITAILPPLRFNATS